MVFDRASNVHYRQTTVTNKKYENKSLKCKMIIVMQSFLFRRQSYFFCEEVSFVPNFSDDSHFF